MSQTRRLVARKRETDSSTGGLDQMVVAEYFAQRFGEQVDSPTPRDCRGLGWLYDWARGRCRSSATAPSRALAASPGGDLNGTRTAPGQVYRN
jgi:hypothetical protein